MKCISSMHRIGLFLMCQKQRPEPQASQDCKISYMEVQELFSICQKQNKNKQKIFLSCFLVLFVCFNCKECLFSCVRKENKVKTLLNLSQLSILLLFQCFVCFFLSFFFKFDVIFCLVLSIERDHMVQNGVRLTHRMCLNFSCLFCFCFLL